MTSFFRFGSEEKGWLYGPFLADLPSSQDALQAIALPFERDPSWPLLHRMLYADMVTRLPEHTLMLADRMSMAHGLETRCPLLDHELAEFCAGMPAHLKIRGRTTKYAMRKAARGFLPPEIIRRPKQGFMFPVAFWLDRRTLPAIAARLRSGPLVRDGWVRADAIDRLAREHLARRTDHHVRIWMLLNLDAWHRIYLGGEAVETAGVAAGEAAAS
jgi:asparagine synthase (glutamine-hydrolysing)